MDSNQHEGLRRFFASPTNLVLLGFLGVGGFFLIAEHWAHLVGAGPLLLLLLFCGGMHFFMHGAHGGHGGHGANAGPDDRTPGEGARHDSDITRSGDQR